MSSTSTTWAAQGNSKAGGTVTTTDALTTGALTADTLQLSSNKIKASDGGVTITLATNDNVTIAGDLTVGGGKITVGNPANRGWILLDNGSATDTPGYIAFTTPDGDVRTLWIDNDGKVRTSNSVPSDSGGTIVGTQSA